MRHAWLARLVGRGMALYVRLVVATCRVRASRGASRDQAVLVLWHEYNLAALVAALRLRRHRYHVSFSTQTFRGEVMNALLAALGAGSVPLPAEDRRAESAHLARRLAGMAGDGASLVVSPDGPVGPYRRAKPGALMVARQAGLPLLPWAVTARPTVRLTGRWDRQLVPLPFCRLVLEEGPPITVAPDERLRPLGARLQAALDDVAARADARERR